MNRVYVVDVSIYTGNNGGWLEDYPMVLQNPKVFTTLEKAYAELIRLCIRHHKDEAPSLEEVEDLIKVGQFICPIRAGVIYLAETELQ